MKSRMWQIACLGILLLHWTHGSLLRDKEKKILDNILDKTRYDPRMRPGGLNDTDGPTIVRINILVRNIRNFDDRKMKYDMQLTFREQWIDERLKYDADDIKFLTLKDKSSIWTPDLFFSNELESHRHEIPMPNQYIRIFSSGSVLYSERLSLTMSCPMNLKLFPLDSQVCSCRMASYGWTTDDLAYLWKDGDPVQVVKNLHIEKFSLKKFVTDYCNSKTNTGEYSCLKVDMLFTRSNVRHYVTQFFLPSTMLVVISWFSCWLDTAAITTRSVIGLVTLLAATGHSFIFNAKYAVVQYSRASDVWMEGCLCFLFVALVETVVVNYMRRSEKPLVEQLEAIVLAAEADGRSSKSGLKERASGILVYLAKMSNSMKLDIFSRIFFPIVFITFTVHFYVKYSSRDEE